MDLEFKRKIEERMQDLPPSLAAAIKNSGWEKAVFDIGRKHSLHVDDIGSLQNELILVLTGIVHPDEFRSVIINEMGIDSGKADAIISDINIAVNEKIKSQLKDELVEEDTENLDDSEMATMKRAGISLGGEAEEEKIIEMTEHTPSEENKLNINIKESVAPVTTPAEAPKPEPQMNQGGVFKTKTTSIETSDKPKGFLDPYREPIE